MLNRRQAFIGHNKTIKMVPVYHEQQRQLAYIEQMNKSICLFLKHSQIACAWLELFSCNYFKTLSSNFRILYYYCSFQIHSISLGHVYFIDVLQIITYLGLLYTIIYYLELQITELLFTEPPKNKTQRKISASNPCRLRSIFFLIIFFMQLGHANSMPVQMGLNIIQ